MKDCVGQTLFREMWEARMIYFLDFRIPWFIDRGRTIDRIEDSLTVDAHWMDAGRPATQ